MNKLAIVGVLPDFPQYPRENDVYMPTSACPFRDSAGQRLPQGHRSFSGLRAIGRLVERQSLGSASAEIAGVAGSFERDYPNDYRRAAGLTGRAVSLDETLVSGSRPMLFALSGTTLLVLIIACANVANLSLARMAHRRREFAVRAALGAGRGALLRQLVTESVLVALTGGLLGLALAWLTQEVRKFCRTVHSKVWRNRDRRRVLIYPGVSVLTGLVFGAVPLLEIRRNLMASMRDGSASAGEGAGRHRLRAVLVVAQVAVSFVLLVAAALLLESLHRMSTVELGYETRSDDGDFQELHERRQRHGRPAHSVEHSQARASRLMSAAVTSPCRCLRFSRSANDQVEGRAWRSGLLQVDASLANEEYFETWAFLLAGRRSGSPTRERARR
jgi:putative ABC transport system permease protein